MALSLEYGFKALYAVAIGALAGYSPADLSVMTIIEGGDGTAVDGVTSVRDLGGGRSLVRTQRYEAYSKILEAWAGTGTTVVEIAGNTRILLTIIAHSNATPLYRVRRRSSRCLSNPSRGRGGSGSTPGFPRSGAVIKAATSQGMTFEHAYD